MCAADAHVLGAGPAGSLLVVVDFLVGDPDEPPPEEVGHRTVRLRGESCFSHDRVDVVEVVFRSFHEFDVGFTGDADRDNASCGFHAPTLTPAVYTVKGPRRVSHLSSLAAFDIVRALRVRGIFTER